MDEGLKFKIWGYFVTDEMGLTKCGTWREIDNVGGSSLVG